jgi:hypothetical protein
MVVLLWSLKMVNHKRLKFEMITTKKSRIKAGFILILIVVKQFIKQQTTVCLPSSHLLLLLLFLERLRFGDS